MYHYNILFILFQLIFIKSAGLSVEHASFYTFLFLHFDLSKLQSSIMGFHHTDYGKKIKKNLVNWFIFENKKNFTLHCESV